MEIGLTDLIHHRKFDTKTEERTRNGDTHARHTAIGQLDIKSVGWFGVRYGGCFEYGRVVRCRACVVGRRSSGCTGYAQRDLCACSVDCYGSERGEGVKGKRE